MIRLLQWFVKRIGSTTLLLMTLLVLALMSVILTLSGVVRGLDFELLATMSVLGAGTGWLLARSRFRGRIALPMALTIVLTSVIVRVGQLGDELFALLRSLLIAVADARLGNLNVQPVLTAFEPLSMGIVTLAARLFAWGRAIALGQPGFDVVASALVWSFVIWLIAAWAAWMLRRAARPFVALVPLLFLLALVLAYTGQSALVLVLAIGALLALMVIVPHLARERRWQTQNIPYAGDLGTDLAFIAVPTIIGMLVLVLVGLAFSPREILQWVQAWNQPEANNAMALPNSLGLVAAPSPATVFDQVRAPGLPRSHLLGAAPELLREVALTVETDDAPQASAAPYYWLSSTYDLYTGRGWLTSNWQMKNYRANEPVRNETLTPYHALHETVRVHNPTGLVYAAGDVVSVDHDFEIAWRANQDLFAAQVSSNLYRVESRVPAVDENELRSASEIYPEWIRARYLALPDDVPPRVLALARDLTATAPTPYARALAIENYLRTIPYTLDLPAPPTNRDVVDYFLFDLRRGYCDYYATAMAVLARAAGLPARIAVGYATGTYDSASGKYVVTEAEAHSWTQIYFPEYGWVDFEPTSARAVITYDVSRTSPYVPLSARDEPNSHAVASDAIQNGWLIVSSGLLFVGVLAVVLILADVWRLRHLPSAAALGLLYRRMYRAAQHLGLAVTPSHTAYQVSTMLQGYFAARSDSNSVSAWQPLCATIAVIAELYVQATYGGRSPDAAQIGALIQRWQNARWRVWFALILHLVEKQARPIREMVPRNSTNETAAQN